MSTFPIQLTNAPYKAHTTYMVTHRDLIAERGGIRPLARALGHRNHTTVQGWWDRSHIPASRMEEVEQVVPLPSPRARSGDGSVCEGVVMTKGKLTADQARAIFARYVEPAPKGYRQPTYQMVGDEFGVSAVMVHKIVRGKSWRKALDKAA